MTESTESTPTITVNIYQAMLFTDYIGPCIGLFGTSEEAYAFLEEYLKDDMHALDITDINDPILRNFGSRTYNGEYKVTKVEVKMPPEVLKEEDLVYPDDRY